MEALETTILVAYVIGGALLLLLVGCLVIGIVRRRPNQNELADWANKGRQHWDEKSGMWIDEPIVNRE